MKTLSNTGSHWKGKTRYRIEGKLTTPMTDTEFIEGMAQGKFTQPAHKAYVALLYYFAVRKLEGLRVIRSQFHITKTAVIFEVGKRLKHGIVTPPLKIPRKLPYVDSIVTAIEKVKDDLGKIFSFCARTAYNAVRRVFYYPHFFRLSRITNFFLEGWTIAEVHSWTGLSLTALNYYLGLVDIDKMSKTLK
jgi:hypothetical protein